MGWEDAKDARLVLKGTLTLTPSLYCACAFPSDGVTELETFEAIHFDRDRLLLFVAVAAAEEDERQQQARRRSICSVEKTNRLGGPLRSTSPSLPPSLSSLNASFLYRSAAC